MLFHRKHKELPEKRRGLNSAPDAKGPGPEREDTDKYTIPITYPDRRYGDTKAAMPSDQNVKEAKDWVDFNKK